VTADAVGLWGFGVGAAAKAWESVLDSGRLACGGDLQGAARCWAHGPWEAFGVGMVSTVT
jgi:hypothetical protein